MQSSKVIGWRELTRKEEYGRPFMSSLASEVMRVSKEFSPGCSQWTSFRCNVIRSPREAIISKNALYFHKTNQDHVPEFRSISCASSPNCSPQASLAWIISKGKRVSVIALASVEIWSASWIECGRFAIILWYGTRAGRARFGFLLLYIAFEGSQIDLEASSEGR